MYIQCTWYIWGARDSCTKQQRVYYEAQMDNAVHPCILHLHLCLICHLHKMDKSEVEAVNKQKHCSSLCPKASPLHVFFSSSNKQHNDAPGNWFSEWCSETTFSRNHSSSKNHASIASATSSDEKATNDGKTARERKNSNFKEKCKGRHLEVFSSVQGDIVQRVGILHSLQWGC